MLQSEVKKKKLMFQSQVKKTPNLIGAYVPFTLLFLLLDIIHVFHSVA